MILFSHLAEVKVDEVIRFGGYEGTEVASDDAVPLRPVQVVELLLDRRRDVLFSRRKRKKHGRR